MEPKSLNGQYMAPLGLIFIYMEVIRVHADPGRRQQVHTGQAGNPEDAIILEAPHSLGVQVFNHKVSTQTIITIPSIETLNTLWLGTLDP